MELFGKFIFDERVCTYKFNVNRVIIWKIDVGILRVVGDHIGGRTNEDVNAITFNKFKMYQIPRNIDRFFPNLKMLTINSCNLKNISKHDLMGLKQLRQLTLNGNLISSLPNNLFENSPEIETVSFYGNRIEFIGPNIFDSLKNLKYVNLKINMNIDCCSKKSSGITLDDLKHIIKENCQPKLLEGIEIDELFDYEEMKIFADSYELLKNYSFTIEDYDINC